MADGTENRFTMPIEVDGALYAADGTVLLRGAAGKERLFLPPTVSVIAENAFEGCDSLREISIPGVMRHIGRSAFEGVSCLRCVRFRGSPLQWAEMEIEDGNDALFRAELKFT